MIPALGLLRTNRTFRRLWLARVVSFLGDAMGLVALILYVAEDVGGGTAVGLLLLAGNSVPTLLSPLIGTVADRLEGRRALIVCGLGQAVAVGAIVVFQPPLSPCWHSSPHSRCSRSCSKRLLAVPFRTWSAMRTSSKRTL